MFALTFSLSSCVISFPKENEKIPSEKNELKNPPEVDGRLINSLDKLNYYAAMKTIMDYQGGKGNLMAVQMAKTVIADDDKIGEDSESQNDIQYDDDQSGTNESNGNESSTLPEDDGNKFYYDLYQWGSYTVNRTIYFKIELTDANGFLASRLGTGTVEVVISIGDNYDDLNMITFRNGDKFFSCMYHEYDGIDEQTGAEKFCFAAYRYIEGFYYVKQLDLEHYKFYVKIGKDNVDFYCDYLYTGEETENVSVVKNSGYCIEKTVTYTIEELESYFSQMN